MTVTKEQHEHAKRGLGFPIEEDIPSYCHHIYIVSIIDGKSRCKYCGNVKPSMPKGN